MITETGKPDVLRLLGREIVSLFFYYLRMDQSIFHIVASPLNEHQEAFRI